MSNHPSAAKLRELVATSEDGAGKLHANLLGDTRELLALLVAAEVRVALFTAAAEILDALPTAEERLRNAILSGLLGADVNDCNSIESLHRLATDQARALLSQEASE